LPSLSTRSRASRPRTSIQPWRWDDGWRADAPGAGRAARPHRCARERDSWSDGAPPLVRDVLRGIALKPALSLRPLIAAARQVEGALTGGDLAAARRALSWNLVSRDTSALTAAEVAGATIESVAENLSDSVVAPLVAFRAGGLSAAYAYRMINTADAMLGYHTPELEWFGKAAARVDDVVNLLPARLSAALICCAAPVSDGSPRRALRVALRDAGRTSSPNAGWPMAAMAGALGLRLTKRGHYELNRHGRDPNARDIRDACRIVGAASVLAALLTELV
jgi:adenosylcobinamide-phosphate synthase